MVEKFLTEISILEICYFLTWIAQVRMESVSREHYLMAGNALLKAPLDVIDFRY